MIQHQQVVPSRVVAYGRRLEALEWLCVPDDLAVGRRDVVDRTAQGLRTAGVIPGQAAIGDCHRPSPGGRIVSGTFWNATGRANR